MLFVSMKCLVEIIELEKGVITWLHRKGGGLERHQPLYVINAALYVDLF